MARQSHDLQAQLLEEEMGNCLEEGGEAGGGALQAQEVARLHLGPFSLREVA